MVEPAMNAKVLVVDDDDRALRLMEAMLVSAGFSVILAEGGAQVISKAILNSPDVILLDVMMPGVDGFAVVSKLRAKEETRDIPIVMVTALGEAKDRVRALEAGADDFLTKPVDKTELLTRVRTLVEKSERIRQRVVPKKRPLVPMVSAVVALAAAIATTVFILTSEPVIAEVIVEKKVVREVEIVREVIVEKPTAQREFASKGELEEWLAKNEVSDNVYVWAAPDGTSRSSVNYDCDDFALDLQEQASKDGYLMSVTITEKDGQPHMINLATIGNDIYYIEPQTDEVWFYAYRDLPAKD